MPTLATLEIPADHAAFAGHFPGNPIVPGVVLLDETLHAISSARGVAPSQVTIDSAKFLSAVHPGELLQLAFEPEKDERLRFTIRAPDRIVVSGILSLPATAAAAHEQ
jgi:3-hydroxymyristoyl/3-hydroxydecanoyl-(acyl carrier protein) dehydratase